MKGMSRGMRAGGTIVFLENRTTFLCEHEIFVF